MPYGLDLERMRARLTELGEYTGAVSWETQAHWLYLTSVLYGGPALNP